MKIMNIPFNKNKFFQLFYYGMSELTIVFMKEFLFKEFGKTFLFLLHCELEKSLIFY